MDMTHPISSVVPTLDGIVLEVLASTTEPLSQSVIHGRAQTASISGIRKAVLRLIRTGVVDDVPGGYVLNREHLASAPVLALASLHGGLIERIREHVDRWEPKPDLVGLFGSAARRDGDMDSDVDIFILSGDQAILDLSGDLAHQVQRWTGNSCHVITATSADVRRMRRHKEPLLDNVVRDLVIVSGSRAVLAGAT